MKLLVTGGAGFIGSNFIRYILNNFDDYKVINLDNLTYAGNLDNLKDIQKNPNYKFVKGDICDFEKVCQVLEVEKCDVTINFAAESHVDRSILGSKSFIDTDVLGTHSLLESARKYNLRRFIQISTDEIYGSIEKGSFNEESPISPNNPYSASKASADLLCRSYFITYKLPVIITRSSNNFGPYQYPEKVIPLFITNAIENKPLPLYGDGKNVRDWLYVLDNCAAIKMVLDKGIEGEIYNIGGGNEIENIQLTKMILKFLDKPLSLIKPVIDRPGHDRRYSLNCDKMKKLGWGPSIKFEDVLKETVNWYVQNKDWWQKIKNKSQEFKQYYDKQYKQ